MIIQFSVKNYKVFKGKATLSLVASNYDKSREDQNLITSEKYGLRLLKSAVVYGANASGKSKLMDAFVFFRFFVLNSSKESQKGELINIQPFLLSDESEKESTEFEIIFLHNSILYRYGFEATNEKILSEWLFYKPKTKEVELFYREENEILTHAKDFTKGRMVVREGLVRENALLISVAAQFNELQAISVLDWFKRTRVLSGLEDISYHGFTRRKAQAPEQKAKILELLKAADLGIQDIKLKKLDIDNLPANMPNELKELVIKDVKDKKAEIISDVLTSHKKYNSEMEVIDTVTFSLEDDESAGTNRFFALTGPIIEVLENGYTLIVDELDSKLHPNLVNKLVELFNSKEVNKMNAQLIFNTHDTNLLNSGLFRRDQIWFTNKDKYGEAKLYSLADFKSEEVRKSEPFEANYLLGKYGGVPFLGFFDQMKYHIFEHENEK
jgi:uncharacterized protein